VRAYNGIPLANPKVITTAIAYNEVHRRKYYLSSEGSRIQEDLLTTSIGGLITAKDGGLTQNIRVGIGGSDGFGSIRGQQGHFEQQTKLGVDLLSARPVASGVHRCLINPDLAGVFAHEAFGHFSEADIVETMPAMRQKMRLGTRLGGATVNIIDDATLPGQLGCYRYDDEGVPVRPTQLIKDGVLAGRLHSRRTAAEFGEPLSGHCVAEDYRYAPIVRMGTIFIQPSDLSFDALLQTLGDGLYLLDAKGGQTAGENFTFGANYGYEVRHGKIGPMVRDINISGNLFQTLLDIRAVGNDLELSRTGGCGKGQTNIRSCHGGPHIVIENLVVGGI
jgi:TldD protein